MKHLQVCPKCGDVVVMAKVHHKLCDQKTAALEMEVNMLLWDVQLEPDRKRSKS